MPTLLYPPERPRRKAGSIYRRWSWRRQIVASGLRLTALALLALLAWGSWYLANKGFGRQWRTTVAEELRKRGVEASVRRLTLDPFRGLVAQDLRIYEFKNRDKPIAVISEVSLDINYAALLHRQPFLNALDIRDAEVTFPDPSAPPNAPRAQLKEFRAHIYFPPEQIHISQAEGVFCGVRISATGQLIKRSDYKPSRVVTEAEWRQRMQLLQRVAAELNSFTFAGGAPTLQIKFTGDLAEMEQAHVEANLHGEQMRRGAYEIKSGAAAVEWINRRLDLKRIEWSDHAGAFGGRGSWSAHTGQAEFQAQSSANVKPLLEAIGFGQLLADASFTAPPAIELSGSANFTEKPVRFRAIGRAAVGEFTYRNIAFLGLAADFSWDRDRTMLRDVRLRHATGDVVADVLDTPGDFRLNIESSINPAAVRTLADTGISKFLSEWEWPRSPAVRMAIRAPSRDPKTWTGEGSIAQQRTRFRGVWMNSATANVRLEPGALTFEQLRVVRDEGVGTGAFTYDFANHEVRVDDIRTKLRPTDAIYWIDPNLHKVVVPYKFRAPPNLTANGVVTFKGRRQTRLEIEVDAAGGMDYMFLGKTLPFDRTRGRLLITDDRVQLSNMEGALYEGVLRGAADVLFGKEEERYSAKIDLERIDFPRLTDLYFNYQTARGRLAGAYEFQVLGNDTRTMQGAGNVKVSNGDVFAIPVFGPLSGLVSAIVPGAGYSVARQATASFTVAKGVIKTDDFKVSGKLFGMVGHGEIHFLDDKLDFDIRIDARGPGVLLTPVYELFEYKGEGSFSKPNWHPKRF